MKQCKLEAIHYEFQTDGTRYNLVLVDDPYGGIKLQGVQIPTQQKLGYRLLQGRSFRPHLPLRL